MICLCCQSLAPGLVEFRTLGLGFGGWVGLGSKSKGVFIAFGVRVFWLLESWLHLPCRKRGRASALSLFYLWMRVEGLVVLN